MQNRGLIKFFAIIFALVSIYQLTFTFIANKVKSDAKAFANGNQEKEIKYLDSIGKQKVFSLGFTDFTYNEVADKQINKGLDLEGGINVTLQISVKDVLKGLANNTSNALFNKALADAKKNQQGNQSFLDAFFEAFEKASAGSGIKLASPDVFGNRNLADEINFNMSDSQVKAVIAKKVDESVQSAFGVLRERIDKFGVTQPNIVKLGNTGRILVELPGAKDVDRAKKLLSSTAQLEFWETYKVEEVASYLMTVNEALKKTEKVEPAVKETKSSSKLNDLLVDKSKDSASNAKGNNPLFDKLMPLQQGGSIIGMIATKDTATVNAYLKRTDIKSLLPANLADVKFLYGKVKDEEAEAVEVYAIKGNRTNVPPMSGSVLIDAADTFDQMGKPAVSMQMNGKGAKIWEELTGRVFSQKNAIAIVLDDVVYSAPGVTSGPIAGGRSEISGTFKIDETKDLANVLRAGKLPAAAEIVQSEVVGPSLGQKAIDNGTMSAIVGLLAVMLWMWVYYGKSGTYANIALVVNLLFLFGILASLGAVLTLPGIAGIVLTLGTAVDANIIIYERAKEELRHGLNLGDAVQKSFSWTGAMRSIIDANVTHVLTGAILYTFGTGPIKGFATTLLIGIVTSLFTSIFITRIFLDRAVAKNITLSFTTDWSKNWFTGYHFDFLKIKKFTYGFSLVVTIISLVSIFFVNGLDQGVDFVGGRTFQVKFEKPVDAAVVSEELGKVFGVPAEAKVFGDSDQLRITTKYKIEEEGVAVDEEVNKLLYQGLSKYFPGMDYKTFITLTDGKKLAVLSGSKVGAAISNDIKTNSFWAVIGAMLVVGLYLVISFRKLGYSLGAVAAVAHDVIFVLGIYSICYKFMPFHMEMDQHFIAAILTVIGYSMNDTVIVFDRIREFLAGNLKGNFNHIVNESINTTLSRTINTSLTMILVLAIMFVFGGESIRGFIFAMLIGIIVGTYSSLFIATPVLVDTLSKKDKEEIEKRHAEMNA
ncbi:protein translocase subunit SecDF [Flavobacterium columnare NBRC 100251 = ATCC 23463]|uniref:Multifunctional fusion protein n=1 Tax=Flavobacterium columnare (strain ATCC 49512 / CIP 103533 / TG 44/87) TaxID=1041826 RepID=G8X5F4_FLACA|nr:protein translocase subunit SecDF [Flavobacterium columnare]AEW86186.1 bifunctional preprotein translocase subunit SecD/SecF [Flavobacterium columnare ATCC 49512]ANO48604.1 bifunctional preprotein translocase subunit SecD/SecF [Flavobacterium columnare]APT23350.1 protein translocase subunit SecDF [Flavobacterium columnare]MBF6652011.1 protein translocase subunit SecDF [Flavobacterium columnare]MBF6654385.1 protein translocase subunit SecDF [Flavobacterium columnare]